MKKIPKEQKPDAKSTGIFLKTMKKAAYKVITIHDLPS